MSGIGTVVNKTHSFPLNVNSYVICSSSMSVQFSLRARIWCL